MPGDESGSRHSPIRPYVAGAAAAWAAYALVGHWAGQATALRRRPDLPELVTLTFDDGPSPKTTPAFLERLARLDVPATFFMLGERAARHPSVAREVLAAGHEVGNHSFSHRPPWALTPWGAATEVRQGADAIAAAAGRAPIAFRPPWGFVNAVSCAVARRLHQPLVLWSVRSEGFRWKPTVEEMVEHIATHVRGGDIINLHDAGGFPDTPERVLTALPLVVARLREAGLRFVPLSAML